MGEINQDLSKVCWFWMVIEFIPILKLMFRLKQISVSLGEIINI